MLPALAAERRLNVFSDGGLKDDSGPGSHFFWSPLPLRRGVCSAPPTCSRQTFRITVARVLDTSSGRYGAAIAQLAPLALGTFCLPATLARTHPRSERAASRAGYLWAELMRRTFGFDVLACPRCGGRLRLITLVDQAAAITRMLAHLRLPTAVPEPHAARPPPLAARGVPPGDDSGPLFDPCS